MILSRSPQSGFTLLEVLAALAIAATGLLAVSQTVSTSIDVSSGTESRMVAYWVAGNNLAELRMSEVWPNQGVTRQSTSMAGRKWNISREVKSTADIDVVRVEVSVYTDGDEHRQALLNTYLARLEEPIRKEAE